MGGLLPPAERRSSALLGLYAALSLLLLFVGEYLPTSALRGAGALLFAPLDRVVLSVDRAASAWRENQRLKERVTELQIENARLLNAGVENERLRRELDLPEWKRRKLKPVEVLALSGEPPVAATLSAGRQQGVQVGDGVVTPDGLLGRVREVYDSQCRAILVTHHQSAVACEVESTGVLGVLRFVSSPLPRLMLTGVSLADTVRVGQRVLTSGLSSRYPRGLPVGTITRVGENPGGLTLDLEVRPAARLSRLRLGFIVGQPDSLEVYP